MVAGVGHIDVSAGIGGDTLGEVEARGASVAIEKPGHAGTGQGRDEAARCDLADAVVVSVRDVAVCAGVRGRSDGICEGGGSSLAVGEAGGAASGEGAHAWALGRGLARGPQRRHGERHRGSAVLPQGHEARRRNASPLDGVHDPLPLDDSGPMGSMECSMNLASPLGGLLVGDAGDSTVPWTRADPGWQKHPGRSAL